MTQRHVGVLREAIDSVYAQTYDDWEIVFWDNQSTDDSAKIAKSYDERLRYFLGTEFLPLGAARNIALQQCRGEFIAYLDCDDVWTPDRLEKQIAVFRNNPYCALVYADCHIIEAEGKIKGRWSQRNKLYRGQVLDRLLQVNFVPIPTVLMRKAVFADIGGISIVQLLRRVRCFSPVRRQVSFRVCR
jgi:glycosyltransferase involved in cell wall biosynthesis